MTLQAASKDYPVCRECRIRKIRCGRERPKCANCIRFGHSCEWSSQGKKPNQTALLASQINDLRNQVDRLDDAITEIQASMRMFHAISSHEPQPKLPCVSCTGSGAVGSYLNPCGSAPQSTQKGGSHLPCSPYSNAKGYYLDSVFDISASVQELASTHDASTNSQPSDASHRVLSSIFPESVKPHQATIRLERIPTLAGSANYSPGLADDSPCLVAESYHLSGAYREEHQLVSGPTAWGHSDGTPGHSMYLNPYSPPQS
ncbi:hypothetical protein BO94DRAFT_585893 [Aspergillus sclerotioniger CBS 115572]|uniref:Zn(2)-C6 fungal-type domain-containing protein n=1 Tax=Aspergillus sclerotioniger CBS 115572 TaxID=1450535 RepID=A0A317WMP4_9EURO|nr:hypothetical protein BO94DRAFT_585893 [Aspergillus sclerotioniger CBS 115572]PWY87345.1 hypothetical protein BO94DRAFT_585893 [Aspergillus sclerotioniger CBS 115572]